MVSDPAEFAHTENKIMRLLGFNNDEKDKPVYLNYSSWGSLANY